MWPSLTPRARAARTKSKLRVRRDLSAHDANEVHPAEEEHDSQEPPETGFDDAGQNDEEVEDGQAGPYFRETLQQQIRPAAEIAPAQRRP